MRHTLGLSTIGPMQRRQAVEILCVSGVGALVGGGVLCAAAPTTQPLPTMLGPASSFAAGSMRVFSDIGIVVVRLDSGLALLSMRCTHLGCRLRVIGQRLQCPCHGGTFDNQGNVQSGPPTTRLAWFEGGVDPAGQVFVYLDRLDPDRRVVGV
jgi:nitrite reductase/ring-hydroxylating ferredoxin subunit